MKVYELFCAKNGKRYIGITVDMERRLTVHFNTKEATVLGRAIRKYGRDAFSVSILEEVSSWKAACLREKHYIKTLNTKVPYGMNMTDGGEGVFGLHHTEETKKKMSASHKGKYCGMDNPMYGKVGNNKGKKWSPEQRKKLSDSCKGRIPWNKGKMCPQLSNENHYMFGKQMKESTKKKLSIAQSGKQHTEDTKRKLSAMRKGQFLGTKSSQAKLTEKDVLKIRALYQQGTHTQKQLAAIFAITQSMVHCIVQRKNWTHI